MKVLEKALKAANIKITGYQPKKQRSILTSSGAMDVNKFIKTLMDKLGAKMAEHPEILKACYDISEMSDLVEKYAEENLEEVGEGNQVVIPDEFKKYTLNIDMSSKEDNSKRFFITTEEDLVSKDISGRYYLDKCNIPPPQAIHIARPIVPKFMPRRPRGVTRMQNPTTLENINYYNTYVPPEWEQWKSRNPEEWKRLPAKPPMLVMKLLKHLIPLKEEREYLYAWVYTSLTARSYVYLVLCGAPGAGKNRFKLLLRALHGMSNTADGKKETFGANDNKFNGQMEDNTLIWLDEFKYTHEMEPRLKEYQNDYISIERKGLDATKSTEIYPSMVISNNYPRDNYLPFDARKFAPLVLADRDLKFSMATEEIAELSDRIDSSRPDFDVRYVAQIAKWILSVGAKHIDKWPYMEYKGPKFWEIAHASMSRWQKIAVMAATTTTMRGPMPGWDEKRKAFLWSKMEEGLRKKKEYESKDYRDTLTVKSFFDSFRDAQGNLAFQTEDARGSKSFHDFWVKPINGLLPLTGGITLDTVDRDLIDTPEGGVIRPPGLSNFQWRKLQEKMKGSDSGKDIEEKEDL